MAERPVASPQTWLVWPLTVLLAVVGGAAVLQVPKRADESTPPPAAPNAGPAGGSEEFEPLRLVQDYFQFEAEKPASEKTLPDVRVRAGPHQDGAFRHKVDTPRATPASPTFALPDRIPPFRFETLIVSVPDPVDSKFAYEFDAVVQAVQWAFQARGMILHSSALPWKRGSDGKPVGDLHRRAPGALLFRRIRKEPVAAERRSELEPGHWPTGTDEPYRRVVSLVLLVGENPISGPHKLALRKALDTVESLRLAVKFRPSWLGPWFAPVSTAHDFWPPPDQPLAIVGPYYSGSASILKNTLRAWRHAQAPSVGPMDPPRFRLISGSATGIDPVDLFFEPWCTFQATVIPTNLMINAVLDYLSRRHGGPITGDPEAGTRAAARVGTIAYLLESNTGFGNQLRKQTGMGSKSRPPSTGRVIDLPFPSSISQLKVDLDKLTAAANASVPVLPADFVAPPLPVKDELQVDGVPLQDRDSSVALAAQALREILDTIDREGVRVVGITATDDRDVVFLNRLLKKYCPAVRVFATGPSLVMTQPAESYHMRGMVLGSTYPLFPPNQDWVDGGRGRRLPFPGHSAQGVHNAVLAQFGEYDKLVEYRPPDFGAGGAVAPPPIWVSVIGQNGDLVPVRMGAYDDSVKWPPAQPYRDSLPDTYVFDPPAPGQTKPWHPPAAPDVRNRPGAGDQSQAPPAQLTVTPARGFLLLLALLAIGAVVVVVNLAGTWRGWYLFDERQGLGAGPEAVARVLVWASGTAAVAACVPVLGAIGFAWDRSHTWAVAVGLVSVIVAAAISIPVLLVGRQRRVADPSAGRMPHLGTLIVMGATAVAVVVAAGVWGLTVDPDRRFLWLVRASDLTSGLSPLLPSLLLAAAVAALALARLKQASVLHKDPIACPFPEGDSWARVRRQGEVTRAQFDGWGWLRQAATRPQTYLVLVPFLLFGSWFCAVVHPTAETRPWDACWRVGFWLTGTLVAVTLVRLLTLWAGVGRLLDQIGGLPMATAFERLPDKIGRLFQGHLLTRRPPVYEEVVAHARSRVRADPALSNSEQAAEFLNVLRPGWTARTGDEVFGRSEPPDPAAAKPTLDPREEFAAVVIVQYVSQFLIPLRALTLALTVAAPLLLLAAASYPFQPERPLLYALMALLVAVVAGILYVLYDLNKNELVSRITKTTPNRFTPDRGFLMSVGTYVLPVLGVAALYLVGTFRVVLEPLLSALR